MAGSYGGAMTELEIGLGKGQVRGKRWPAIWHHTSPYSTHPLIYSHKVLLHDLQLAGIRFTSLTLFLSVPGDGFWPSIELE